MAQSREQPKWGIVPESPQSDTKREGIDEILMRYDIESAMRTYEIEAKILDWLDEAELDRHKSRLVNYVREMIYGGPC